MFLPILMQSKYFIFKSNNYMFSSEYNISHLYMFDTVLYMIL